MTEDKEKLQYLFRSLKHHPSPYLIYELDGSIRWANLAAKYIFRTEETDDLKVLIPKESLERLESKEWLWSEVLYLFARRVRDFVLESNYIYEMKERNGWYSFREAKQLELEMSE